MCYLRLKKKGQGGTKYQNHISFIEEREKGSRWSRSSCIRKTEEQHRGNIIYLRKSNTGYITTRYAEALHIISVYVPNTKTLANLKVKDKPFTKTYEIS